MEAKEKKYDEDGCLIVAENVKLVLTAEIIPITDDIQKE